MSQQTPSLDVAKYALDSVAAGSRAFAGAALLELQARILRALNPIGSDSREIIGISLEFNREVLSGRWP